MAAAPHVNGVKSNTPSRTPRSGTPAVGTHVSVGNNNSIKNNKLQERKGYKDISFPGKEEQLKLVIKTLLSKGFIPPDLVENEVAPLFFVHLIPGMLVLFEFGY